MRVLITGGLGFIGQNLALHLRRNNPSWEISAIDWFDGASEAEEEIFNVVHKHCFASDEIMSKYNDVDVIIHLAAYTTVQESISDPLRSLDNNVIKTIKLLEYVRHNSPHTKIIFASTGGAIIGEYDGKINEQIAARPLSPYGASKLAVEGLLSAYNGSFGVSSASMRFSNVYGPNSFRKSSVIAAFCKSYLKEGKIQINGDGQQTRDYIYVDDISEAILQVILQDEQGVFQLGTGIGTSILELARIFQDIDADKNIELDYAQALSGEVRHNKADISHIQKTLGFEPKIKIEQGIYNTLNWFKKMDDCI